MAKQIRLGSTTATAIPETPSLAFGESCKPFTPRLTFEHTSDDVTISGSAKDLATLRSALISLLYLLDTDPRRAT